MMVRRHFNFSEYPFCIGDLNTSRFFFWRKKNKKKILEVFKSPIHNYDG